MGSGGPFRSVILLPFFLPASLSIRHATVVDAGGNRAAFYNAGTPEGSERKQATRRKGGTKINQIINPSFFFFFQGKKEAEKKAMKFYGSILASLGLHPLNS